MCDMQHGADSVTTRSQGALASHIKGITLVTIVDTRANMAISFQPSQRLLW